MNIRPYRRLLRESVERLTGVRMFRRLPQGLDVFYDLRRLMPSFTPQVIFDVGANVGQSTKEFLSYFPTADIYCFEPVGSTFAKLQQNVANHANVRCYQQALGSKSGPVVMRLCADSAHNSLKFDSLPVECQTPDAEEVTLETLTGFCRREGIERIDLLKIDVEGQDLDVLQGGVELFDEGRVGVVQLEAGMNPTNSLHVPFQELVDFMQSRGYLLFGIYEQLHEWRSGKPLLRRCNPVFFRVPSQHNEFDHQSPHRNNRK